MNSYHAIQSKNILQPGCDETYLIQVYSDIIAIVEILYTVLVSGYLNYV